MSVDLGLRVLQTVSSRENFLQLHSFSANTGPFVLNMTDSFRIWTKLRLAYSVPMPVHVVWNPTVPVHPSPLPPPITS